MVVKNQEYDANINGTLFTVTFPEQNVVGVYTSINGEGRDTVENFINQDPMPVTVGRIKRVIKFEKVLSTARDGDFFVTYLKFSVASL